MNKVDWAYYNDLCALVSGEFGYSAGDYDRLLRCLYDLQFYIIDDMMDDKWFEDIEELRIRLNRDYGGENEDDYNVFEALVAIALAMENRIMTNSELGDRTVLWFWSMLENLEVVYTDYDFDEEYTEAIIERWLSRNYDRNGDGSPFPLKNSGEDLRNASIWRMAQLWLAENFKGRW